MKTKIQRNDGRIAKALRRTMGYTQKEMAVAFNIAEKSLARLESQKKWVGPIKNLLTVYLIDHRLVDNFVEESWDENQSK